MTRQSSIPSDDNILDELFSTESEDRSHAIAAIRASKASSPRLIAALKKIAAEDQSSEIRTQAKDALTDLEVKSDWRKEKLAIITMLFVAALLATAPSALYIIAIWAFPVGLYYWYADWDNVSNITGGIFFVILGWLLYLGIAMTIVRSNKRVVVVILYIVLTLLLILNVHGCRVQDANYW